MVFMVTDVMSQEKLYVFFPATIRPQAIQEKMTVAMKDVKVTVFGRYNDFTSKIMIEPPDAIITKPALIEQLGNYVISLNGRRQGKKKESYVLLSINDTLEVASITTETVIGVIDVLGRTGMKTFAGQFFPVEPKLKRVTKVEDLLPLLSFNMAAGVLIEDVFVKYIKNTSQLQFNNTPLSGSKNGIIACGIKKDGSAENVVNSLKKNNADMVALFEIDSWKEEVD
jgi:hypothetical protein